MLMLKNRPVVGFIFGWSLMIISEEAPDFLEERLFVSWQFGRGVVPWQSGGRICSSWSGNSFFFVGRANLFGGH